MAGSEHYLDSSATTPVDPRAARVAYDLMTVEWGNPSSLHDRGFAARQALEHAREQVARGLGASPEEIVFTSGGTEANNLAIFGAAAALRRRGDRIVTTQIEHESVLNAARELEDQGFEVVYLPPERDGTLSESALAQAINEKTVLVSLMLVNNETGALLPVQAARRALNRCKSPGVLHVDGVQAFGKMELSPKKLGADLVTVSAHKIHGPKGAGALYVKKGVRVLPRAFGGGQERALRSGTESVPLLGAFGAAVELLPPVETSLPRVEALARRLRAGLERLPGVALNSPPDGLPYVVNFSAGRVRAETMLHFLSQRGVYVSAGSACGRAKPSHVLTAMGLPKERVASALRASFSWDSTEDDVDALLAGLAAGLESLSHE